MISKGDVPARLTVFVRSLSLLLDGKALLDLCSRLTQ